MFVEAYVAASVYQRIAKLVPRAAVRAAGKLGPPIYTVLEPGVNEPPEGRVISKMGG